MLKPCLEGLQGTIKNPKTFPDLFIYYILLIFCIYFFPGPFYYIPKRKVIVLLNKSDMPVVVLRGKIRDKVNNIREKEEKREN